VKFISKIAQNKELKMTASLLAATQTQYLKF